MSDQNRRLWDFNEIDPEEYDPSTVAKAFEDRDAEIMLREMTRYRLYEEPKFKGADDIRWLVLDMQAEPDEDGRPTIYTRLPARKPPEAAEFFVRYLNIAHALRVLNEDRRKRGVLWVPRRLTPGMLKGIRFVSPRLIIAVWDAVMGYIERYRAKGGEALRAPIPPEEALARFREIARRSSSDTWEGSGYRQIKPKPPPKPGRLAAAILAIVSSGVVGAVAAAPPSTGDTPFVFDHLIEIHIEREGAHDPERWPERWICDPDTKFA